MLQGDICPQCHTPTTLFETGTLTPQQFFSSQNEYKIAASETRQRLPIYVCQVCGHGFTPLNVDPSRINQWYQSNSPDLTFVAEEKARRRTARTILRRAEVYMPAKGRLLDIGAGPGIFVSEADRRGWNASGLELSTWAVRYAQEQYGVAMKQGGTSRLDEFPPHSFDAVTLFDVIEHVADPQALIHAAARVLRPGGILILTTPRFDSLLARIMGRHWYCIFPAHIQYFTRRSLSTLLESADLQILNSYAHTRYLSGRYLRQRLKTFLTGTSTTLNSASDRSLIIPINFGDEFEVYARKRAD